LVNITVPVGTGVVCAGLVTTAVKLMGLPAYAGDGPMERAVVLGKSTGEIFPKYAR
jgi:hypothetical protein